MTDFDAPEFRLPFTFTSDGSALEVPQDSDTEIQQSVYAILAYELGFRTDMPEFGIPDQAFKMDGVDLDQLQSVIIEWDPRAREILESDPTWLVTQLQTIVVRRQISG